VLVELFTVGALQAVGSGIKNKYHKLNKYDGKYLYYDLYFMIETTNDINIWISQIFTV
jgi:hypothetical protein